MDPYLEDRRVWEDFHTTFLVALRAALKPQLPPDFVARLERRECLKTEIREVFLEVRRVREPGEVVTVIELLSPANKESGRGREEYLRKRRDLLASDAHLIELDFLRGGEYTLAPDRKALLKEYGRWDYLVSLHRAPAIPGYHDFAIWPITLRDRLPEILIPLTYDQPDLALDLQAVFTRAYDDGPTETLDYTKPCAPPLSDTDALWAKSLSPAGSK